MGKAGVVKKQSATFLIKHFSSNIIRVEQKLANQVIPGSVDA